MVTIRLLGPPAIERDGRPDRPPRGRKSWALLAYLLLAERPPGRRHLAELLFADAADPLGALRWTLAELRRTVGPGLFGGDPVDRDPGPDVSVDLDLLTDADGDPTVLLDLVGELLEGVELAGSPTFDSWLLVQRHRISAAVGARLHAAAVALLAANRPGDAVPFAAAAVARNPLEEGGHELLVRGLAMTGDRAAAERQVAACAELLRRELGVAASPALYAAASVGSASVSVRPLAGRAAAVTQLDAGRAAIAAGAVDAGLECLRRAVTEAATHGDAALRARALAALGGALVHAVRGHDEEGALVLHEAVAHAVRSGERGIAVTAWRELGFIEVQAGRRETAESWLTRAAADADSDSERAAILGVRGMNSSDTGDYPAAFTHLGGSVELARGCGDHRQHAWSLSLIARAHLLRGETAEATAAVEHTLTLARDQRWIAFLPWPQAIRGELHLAEGRLTQAAEVLETAWAAACQLGDPCWEGMAARGLGRLHARRGDRAGATEWFDTASRRCARVPDRYQWVHGHVLDAAVGAALDRDDPAAATELVGRLATMAARGGMRELVVRAHLHRHRLGDPGALPSARLLAGDVDNPALREILHGE